MDTADPLQRFGYVKVEATSFTVSEPTEPLIISPLFYSEATEEQRAVLEASFGVEPFAVQTIKMERIFVDKILAAEFYYQRGMLFDTSKHLYDIATMLEEERIRLLLDTPDELAAMLTYKREEEKVRSGSDLAQKPFSEFTLFKAVEEDKQLREAFMKMQEIYVFSEGDIIQPDELRSHIKLLSQILLSLNEGLDNTHRTKQSIQQMY